VRARLRRLAKMTPSDESSSLDKKKGYVLRATRGRRGGLCAAHGKCFPAPPPSRTDNAILPQVSAESYKKGGSLSQGFSLALPPGARGLPLTGAKPRPAEGMT
jgi:hypothetical protein